MIYDIIGACTCGLDLLIVFLSLQGYSLLEIAAQTQTSKTDVFRRLKRIRAGIL